MRARVSSQPLYGPLLYSNTRSRGRHGVRVSGVGQIVAYQEFKNTEDAGNHGYNTIHGIRGYDPANAYPLRKTDRGQLDYRAPLSNRIRCRVLMEKYDGDISCAPDPIRMVRAFRDAVAGRHVMQ